MQLDNFNCYSIKAQVLYMHTATYIASYILQNVLRKKFLGFMKTDHLKLSIRRFELCLC